MNKAITWTSYVKYINIETGEILQKSKCGKDKEFIIIKILKHDKVDTNTLRGTREYTKLCRRNPQTSLY